MGEIDTFVQDRNAALLSLDRTKIRRFARKYGVQMPTSEEAFWRAVHKARTGCKHLPARERSKSKAWLRERGSSSHDDGEVS